jgi:osmotically-inducible protein OsmY
MDHVLNDRLELGKVARAAMHLTLLGWTCCAIPVGADEVGGSPATLDAIVVTGKKIQEAVPDAEVKQRVETAMRSDQYFYDEHVTITIKDGVVTLHGIVFDDWDLRTARRIAKRIPGVKRVINDLEMKLGGE